MKKLSLIFFLICLNSFAQDSIQRFPEKTTLIGARKILTYQIDEIEKILNFSSLEISISSGKKIGPIIKDEFETSKLFLLNDQNNIKEKLERYYNSRTFTQTLCGNFSFINIDDDSYSIADFLSEKIEKKPEISDLKLYFHDNTSKSIKFEIDNNLIKTGKRVEKIELDYTFSYPESTAVKLDLINKSYKKNNDSIDLLILEGGKAKIQLSDSLRKSIVAIDFLNKNNKKLTTSGNSYVSKPSDETLAFYKDLLHVYKNTITDIDTKKIISVKSLEENLHQKSSKLKPAEGSSNKAFATYQVNGTPTAMILYLSTKTNLVQGKATVIKNDIDKQVGPYYIAVDTLSNNYGFVDANGKWFKKDVGEKINHLFDNYYLVFSKKAIQEDKEYSSYESIVHRIDSKNNELINCKWEYVQLIAPNILQTQLLTNEAYEIYDGIKNQKLLPGKYGFVKFKNNVFVVRESQFTYGDGRCGAFSSNGSVILPCIYDNVSNEGNFLYTKNYKTSKTQAFTITGTPITNEKLNVVDEFGKDEIALIENEKYKKNYINNKGDVIIETSGYLEIKTFSNGMAAVKGKNNLWGYINTDGKLIIPCVYREARYFLEKYALVNLPDNTSCLIDRQNKIVKKFSTTPSYSSTLRDSNKAEYRMNGIAYDANGNKLK